MLGKTEQRLALVILLTAIIPLAGSVWLAESLFKNAANGLYNPDVHKQLDRGVAIYKNYIKAVRDDMKHQADAIASDEDLRDATKRRDQGAMNARLGAIFPSYPELVSLTVIDGDAEVLAEHDRGSPVDEQKEKQLVVQRQLADPAKLKDGAAPPQLEATFAFEKHYEEELDQAAVVIKNYKDVEQDPGAFYAQYLKAFIAVIAITAVIAVVLGFILARGVTRRINRLANAINLVAAGELGVRVPVTGSDELTELSRVFNRMLSEMQQSRARIEYLQRIGAWQEMAQRLAHEIKNPLTPIQLAVQECHRKYGGEDPRFRALLDTTLEIVEEEVGTLRRLVSNFSNFARLPQAELKESDLRDFLRECKEQLVHLEDASALDGADEMIGAFDGASEDPLGRGPNLGVSIAWEVPDEALRAAIDRQMLRRVLVNLVRNSVQAIRDERSAATSGADGEVLGHVVVSARRDADGAAISIEDDGPGVPEPMRERIFDPYFTTKSDGTGLGLAIVKKVIVEHGGSIDVEQSTRLGGALFIVRLPGPQSLGIVAARERGAASSTTLPPSTPSSRSVL